MAHAKDSDGDGHVALEWGGDDCDDQEAAAHPGAEERCDGADTNCDGLVDNDVVGAPELYLDTDEDGYGDPFTTISSCSVLPGYVTVGGDCNDSDAAVSPNATERCGAIDWDCDGVPGDDDPDVPVDDKPLHYPDGDSDGFGDHSQKPVASCTPVEGFVESGESDCDDAAASVHPEVEEVCADGIDNDCSGDAPECRLSGEMEVSLRSGFSELRVLGAATGGIPATVFAAHAETQEVMAFDVEELAFPAGSEDRFWTFETGAEGQEDLRVVTTSAPGQSGLLISNSRDSAVWLFLSSGASLPSEPTATLRGGAVDELGDGLVGLLRDGGEMWLASSGVQEDGDAAVFIWTEEPAGNVSADSASIVVEADRAAELGTGQGLHFADLDGSGVSQLLVARADPMVVYLVDVDALSAGTVGAVESTADGIVEWPEAGDGTVLSNMDADADGYRDLLVANYRAGAGEVLVFPGQASFGEALLSASDAAVLLEPELGRSKFGTGLAVADLDGDQSDDLLVLSDGELGRASVFYGPLPSTGSGIVPDAELLGPGPDACFQDLVVQSAFDGGVGLFVACEEETLLFDAIGM